MRNCWERRDGEEVGGRVSEKGREGERENRGERERRERMRAGSGETKRR